MAKPAIIVTTCVVAIVILFVIFSYLLSIVNPDLLANNGTYLRRMEGQDFDDDKTDIFYPNEELSAKDNVHFGLEKVPDDYELFPYEESRGNAEIGKRFAQKPARISAVTVKSNIKLGDHILTTDGKTPVTLIVFPLRNNRRHAREKKINKIDRNPKNVLLKIVDDSGEAKLEVIADSARIVYKEEVNNTKKELGTDSKVFEIRPNNTLLYNVKDQSFKIVNIKTPYNKISHNSTPGSKNVEEIVETISTSIQSTDDSTLTVTKITSETLYLTTTLISNNLSVATEITTVNDNLNTVTVMRKK